MVIMIRFFMPPRLRRGGMKKHTYCFLRNCSEPEGVLNSYTGGTKYMPH